MAFSAEQALEYLTRANASNRLAHAFLFSGPAGSGKKRLATEFFYAVNGKEMTLTDFHSVEPESKSRRIIVDQIRGLESSLRMRSNSARTKFGVIYEADRLMPQAANAFLKTLEEPPDHSILILITQIPDALLETILSRCIRISLLSPDRRVRSPEEVELLDSFTKIVSEEGFSIATGLRLARVFQEILARARAHVEEEREEAIQKNRALYKQTTDGSWIEEEEKRLAVLTESQYVKLRTALVEAIIEWFGSAIIFQQSGEVAGSAEYSMASRDLAARVSPDELIRRLGGLRSLADHLSRNVQEGLAIEVAFIESFGPERLLKKSRK
jgi:DNA polymerase III subunit delta'